jgi:hypothetical protein
MSSVIFSLPWTTSLEGTVLDSCFINKSLVASCLRAIQPRALHDILRALPLYELHIVATATHMMLRSNISATIRISDLRQHCYRLTNNVIDDERFMQLILALQRRRILTVHTNALSVKDVTDADSVSLLPPLRFLQDVFREESNDTKVVIAARIREALLNPQAPLLTTQLKG